MRAWPPWHAFSLCPPLQLQREQTPSFIGVPRRNCHSHRFAVFHFVVQVSLLKASRPSAYFPIGFFKPFSSLCSPMARLQAGYLVPLDKNLEEDNSGLKIPLSEGSNTIGRSNVLVSDKRISRKHITLTTSTDGSAKLLVDGANPVVINSGNGRKKLGHCENVTIRDGDVVELIPGHYFFKYASHCFNTRSGSEDVGQKRVRQVVDVKISERKVKRIEVESPLENLQSGFSQSKEDNSVEAIRNFQVPDDRLPMTFKLLSVKGLPPWANTSCVRISDVIQGDILFAVLSNYMVDIDWLIPACPALAKVPHVLVIHGEGDGTLDNMKRKKPANWVLHKPPLPISFGTHHSKAIFLVYPRGIRMVVHTANLIYVDWNNKSQGLWMQDFPWKDQNSSTRGCTFEDDLVDYLSALKVRLIASVPGYHTGCYLKKWGHMKLQYVVEECIFDKEFQKSPLVCQLTLGSLDEKWMAEFAVPEISGQGTSGINVGYGPMAVGPRWLAYPTVGPLPSTTVPLSSQSLCPSPGVNHSSLPGSDRTKAHDAVKCGWKAGTGRHAGTEADYHKIVLPGLL